MEVQIRPVRLGNPDRSSHRHVRRRSMMHTMADASLGLILRLSFVLLLAEVLRYLPHFYDPVYLFNARFL
jgi:hypothetical protein